MKKLLGDYCSLNNNCVLPKRVKKKKKKKRKTQTWEEKVDPNIRLDSFFLLKRKNFVLSE